MANNQNALDALAALHASNQAILGSVKTISDSLANVSQDISALLQEVKDLGANSALVDGIIAAATETKAASDALALAAKNAQDVAAVVDLPPAPPVGPPA